MNLLLLSNSRSPGSPYLAHALGAIGETAGTHVRVCFVPFAGVTVAWDDYTATVRQALGPLGLTVESVHEGARVEDADVVMVGGGNSFHLLKHCRDRGLLERISRRVRFAPMRPRPTMPIRIARSLWSSGSSSGSSSGRSVRPTLSRTAPSGPTTPALRRRNHTTSIRSRL